MCKCLSVGQAAFGTITTLSLVTAGAAVGAAMAAKTAATVALVAYSALAITFAALSIAAVTAFMDDRSVDSEKYLENLKNHAGYAVGAMYTFVAQTLVQALVQGLAQGIATAVKRAIAGPDVVIRREHA